MVGEGHTEAVNLELAGVGHVPGAKRIFRAGEPLVELLEVHGIVHGIHARHVRDRRELLRHVTAHALGVGIRGDEPGIGCLDLLELDEELVERRVRNLGSVEGVVPIGVVLEQMAQLGRTRRRLVDRLSMGGALKGGPRAGGCIRGGTG